MAQYSRSLSCKKEENSTVVLVIVGIFGYGHPYGTVSNHDAVHVYSGMQTFFQCCERPETITPSRRFFGMVFHPGKHDNAAQRLPTRTSGSGQALTAKPNQQGVAQDAISATKADRTTNGRVRAQIRTNKYGEKC
jgi:hypothetical protein